MLVGLWPQIMDVGPNRDWYKRYDKKNAGIGIIKYEVMEYYIKSRILWYIIIVTSWRYRASHLAVIIFIL